MPDRLPVLKTYKLYIGGAFPRTESGRTMPLRVGGAAPEGRIVAHACRASRKDLRDAVAAARKAQPAWAAATGYLRGQILYRLAEMLEGKRPELASLIDARATAEGLPPPVGAEPAPRLDGQAEVSLSIDRLVAFAGWADKFASVLGGQNAVAGPYWNITVPEPVGVVGVVCPTGLPLLGLVSLVAPALCAGNTAVVVSGADAAVVSTLGEACATSDLPAGVINLLTGDPAELAPVLAAHRDVDAIHAAGLGPDLARALEAGRADNLKRVTVRRNVPWQDPAACHAPGWIEPLVEFKTVWHPTGA